jgi:hypothetical protein
MRQLGPNLGFKNRGASQTEQVFRVMAGHLFNRFRFAAVLSGVSLRIQQSCRLYDHESL